MVSSNQRSIYEGIRKVVGSSNRGFSSPDPERQPRIVTQGPKAVPGSGVAGPSRAPQVRPGTAVSNTGSPRR